MKNRFTKLVSLLCALALLFGVLPVTVYAEGDQPAQEPAVSEAQQVTAPESGAILEERTAPEEAAEALVSLLYEENEKISGMFFDYRNKKWEW
jgi:hypothetical protein